MVTLVAPVCGSVRPVCWAIEAIGLLMPLINVQFVRSLPFDSAYMIAWKASESPSRQLPPPKNRPQLPLLSLMRVPLPETQRTPEKEIVEGSLSPLTIWIGVFGLLVFEKAGVLNGVISV